uniref:Uncharacterized protein n=1 Tax=viral metagenome TaxID=1070528 RepID=A0A6C0EVJ5_9ZZZZ
MSRKCPPGVICFENITLVMFFIIASIIIYLAYYRSTSNNDGGTNSNIGNTRNNNDSTNGVIISSMGGGNGGGVGGYLDLMPRIGSGYTRGPADVLLNPYTPPLRDDRYINMGFGGGGGGGVPINVPTRSVNSAYRQVGILTRVNGAETILSLMGRPLFPSQDKWQFYTMSDKNQSVKLPVTYKKRSCTSDQGCDNIYNGDTVYVEGYNDAFKATIYDNAIQYSIPYY